MGDRVLLRNLAGRPGHTAKFELKFKGPYQVTRKLGEVDFEIANASDERQVVHHNRLKPFSGHIEEEAASLQEPEPMPVPTTTTPTTATEPHIQPPTTATDPLIEPTTTTRPRRGCPPRTSNPIQAQQDEEQIREPVITRSGRTRRQTIFFNLI